MRLITHRVSCTIYSINNGFSKNGQWLISHPEHSYIHLTSRKAIRIRLNCEHNDFVLL